MTHRIKPGARYKLDPNGRTYENTLPHDIIVDRPPYFVGGRVGGDPIDLLEKRVSPFPNKIEVSFDNAPFDRMSHAFDAREVIMNGVYGKMGARLAAVDRWKPTLRDVALMPWPSPKKESPFPAFVAPERPAEPEAPKPAPDTPAVAALKALLADRQREVGRRKATVDDDRMRAEALEEELAEARKDLTHAETVLAAATAEVDAVISDIVKLGGAVEAQS